MFTARCELNLEFRLLFVFKVFFPCQYHSTNAPYSTSSACCSYQRINWRYPATFRKAFLIQKPWENWTENLFFLILRFSDIEISLFCCETSWLSFYAVEGGSMFLRNVSIYQTTRRHVPVDCTLDSHNLIFSIVLSVNIYYNLFFTNIIYKTSLCVYPYTVGPVSTV